MELWNRAKPIQNNLERRPYVSGWTRLAEHFRLIMKRPAPRRSLAFGKGTWTSGQMPTCQTSCNFFHLVPWSRKATGANTICNLNFAIKMLTCCATKKSLWMDVLQKWWSQTIINGSCVFLWGSQTIINWLYEWWNYLGISTYYQWVIWAVFPLSDGISNG